MLYQIRKQLHASPELAFNEHNTQNIIINNLKQYTTLKLTHFTPTGLLYEYTNDKESNEYILFRADMDALPLTEDTGCDFSSKNEGICHACGHDIHMTILIGLIAHCVENKVQKNILFLFQPAEEGLGGASHIIKTGILIKYNIKNAYALHVTNQFPTGSIGIKPGIIFGIPQEFDIEIIGKGGHVATPQKGHDAFIAGISFINEMNMLVKKQFPPQEPVIFHIGHVNAGRVRNAIPDFCKLEGTTRSLKTEIRDELNKKMHTVAKSVEASHNVQIKITLLQTYAPVINDPVTTDNFIKHLPPDITICETEYSMTGEDFGFFSQLYPSVMFWLGTNSTEGLHSSKFLPDEHCIDIGLKALISILVGQPYMVAVNK